MISFAITPREFEQPTFFHLRADPFPPMASPVMQRVLEIIQYNLCLIAIGMLAGCGEKVQDVSNEIPGRSVTASPVSPPKEIAVFCGACHVVPSADLFPRDAWYREVKRGFDFYTESGRQDLETPGMASVVSWYRSQAPPSLPVPQLLTMTNSPVRFEKQVISLTGTDQPMVADIVWQAPGTESPFDGSELHHRTNADKGNLRFTDMASGHVYRAEIGSDLIVEPMCLLANPSRTLRCDLNLDGFPDLLIAEMGSHGPADHDRGVLYCISGQPSSDKVATPVSLLDKVGRVTDVDVADFDSDGDMDLVVAEFGWLKTGSIWLLENVSAKGEAITAESFRRHKIDPRHGTIDVQVCDINADGHLDFVALISQEYETIDAFIGIGDLTFRHETLMPAQDPSWGSCSVELTDVDQDGDLDAIYCNGDTLDGLILKPYHGVHLLINEGRLPSLSRRLLSLPGASDSATADFDGDGDLDIAVSGFMPPQLYTQLQQPEYDTLCWLEQTSALNFTVHSIETSQTGHLAITTGDFDLDGLPDIAVGNYPGQEHGAVWWNRKHRSPK